jgi:hypothetical protein
MQALFRRATRLGICAMALSGLALRASSIPAGAAASRVSATGTGVTSGRNSVGDVYISGSAEVIRKLCPDNVRDGFICLFSGPDETGQGVAILRGDNQPPSKCDDLPIPFIVVNAENETNRRVEIGDGTCANKGPILDADLEPGEDENIYGDVWITG